MALHSKLFRYELPPDPYGTLPIPYDSNCSFWFLFDNCFRNPNSPMGSTGTDSVIGAASKTFLRREAGELAGPVVGYSIQWGGLSV